jgi:hypothetical protein
MEKLKQMILDSKDVITYNECREAIFQAHEKLIMNRDELNYLLGFADRHWEVGINK